MLEFFGYYGWLGCLMVGFVFGLIYAVKNKKFAQRIHDKYEKIKNKTEDKIDGVKNRKEDK